MINDHKTSMRLPNNETTSGEDKIQLIMLNNWISNKNFEEACARYSVSNNTEILIGSKIGDNMDELLKFFLQRFQDAKEKSNNRETEFILENVELMYYYFHKTTLKRGQSSIESPEWLQNKTVTINPKNKKGAITLALNLQYIERDHQRMSKIEPFINHCNWKGPDFPSHQNDWEKFEKKYNKCP